MTKKIKKSAPKHEHYWNYTPSVWQARDNDNNAVAVARYCACGKMQTAIADKWHPLPKSYVSMRDELDKEIRSI